MYKLTNEMIKDLAIRLGLEPALLKAVQLVEAAGRDGFLADGRPQILFEGHIMYKEVHKKFPDRDLAYHLCKRYSTIFFPKWDKSKYLGGVHEYKRLELAKEIDEECALKSASWGIGQIMGFNFSYCECKDVFEFVHKMSESPASQLDLWFKFFKNYGNCLEYIRTKDWKAFTRVYNGLGQVDVYSQKLENAYNNFKDKI